MWAFVLWLVFAYGEEGLYHVHNNLLTPISAADFETFLFGDEAVLLCLNCGERITEFRNSSAVLLAVETGASASYQPSERVDRVLQTLIEKKSSQSLLAVLQEGKPRCIVDYPFAHRSQDALCVSRWLSKCIRGDKFGNPVFNCLPRFAPRVGAIEHDDEKLSILNGGTWTDVPMEEKQTELNSLMDASAALLYINTTWSVCGKQRLQDLSHVGSFLKGHGVRVGSIQSSGWYPKTVPLDHLPDHHFGKYRAISVLIKNGKFHRFLLQTFCGTMRANDLKCIGQWMLSELTGQKMAGDLQCRVSPHHLDIGTHSVRFQEREDL